MRRSRQERDRGRRGRCALRTCLVALVLTAALGSPSGASAQLPHFDVVGDAAQLPTRLRVVPSQFNKAGAGWLPTRQSVGPGFSATFRFLLTDCRGLCGDGFAFVVQNEGTAALGVGGGGLGYQGIPSVAVEFDSFSNPENDDPGNYHISVHTRGTDPNRAEEAFSLGSTSGGLFAGHDAHTVRIDYTPGTLFVFLDGRPSPVLTVSVDLASTLGLSSGTAFTGFTAGTGAAAENHDILSFDLTQPDPCAGKEPTEGPTSGNDVIVGTPAADTIGTNRGDDYVCGRARPDDLDGGEDDDVVIGNRGNDTLVGGPGSDQVYGGWGDDTLRGGTGDDLITGHAGHDVCTGGTGHDTFVGCEETTP